MSHHFERLLETRCAENPDVSVLRAQWDFDRRLLTAGLQAVSQTFPHYSRHDASHSHTILIQIERVLGHDRLAALSATDLWLLLEAAYHHDAGMIVTNAQLEDLWRNKSFRSYLEGLRLSPDPDFSEAALRLLSVPADSGGHLADMHWPLHVVRAVRVVVAEYRRGEHSARSAEVVFNPSSVGLASPRTDLIPSRLFRLLGRICHAHGQDFAEVMKLPHSEVGVAADVAHPRFVACMLRLGDLLDLDNGRFCPVMLQTVGALPKSSASHVAKHAAICRLRIDPAIIEVEAECTEDDVLNGGYDACSSWLEWLRRELQHQQEQWTQIAPRADFGTLPSPGAIETKLHDLTAIGRIEVDPERVPRLLRGANIYHEPATFVREVLQNAVDATLRRVWHEHSERIAKLPPAEAIQFVVDELDRLPIEVLIEREHDSHSSSAAVVTWKFTVADQGIGIDPDDLLRIRRLGQHSRDAKRRQVIESMPLWLRPSGVFGIGLQSLFLVTPEISIDSRSLLDGQQRRLRLLRSSQRPASLLVAEGDSAQSRRFGTTVRFSMELEKTPSRLRWSSDDAVTERLLRDHDSLTDEELPALIATVKGRIASYASDSWAQITMAGTRLRRDSAQDAWHFDAETSIRIRLHRERPIEPREELLYRGSRVSEFSMDLIFYGISADLLFGNAEEVLTLGRDALRDDAKRAIRDQIRKAALTAVRARLANLRAKCDQSDEVAEASATLLLFGNSNDALVGDDWKRARLSKSVHTLSEIVDLSSFTVVEQASPPPTGQLDLNGDGDAIVTVHSRWADALRTLAHQFDFNAQIVECSRLLRKEPSFEITSRRTRYSRDLIDPVASDATLVQLMEKALQYDSVGARCTIPCPAQFSVLALSPRTRFGWMNHVEDDIKPRMLLPFLFLHDGIVVVRHVRELVEFVAENATRRTTFGAVRDSYLELIEKVEKLMAESQPWANARRNNIGSAWHEFKSLSEP